LEDGGCQSLQVQTSGNGVLLYIRPLSPDFETTLYVCLAIDFCMRDILSAEFRSSSVEMSHLTPVPPWSSVSSGKVDTSRKSCLIISWRHLTVLGVIKLMGRHFKGRVRTTFLVLDAMVDRRSR
ncbi:hypothetical protein KCU87_g555, partial [Aureobasidium melanogenum]